MCELREYKKRTLMKATLCLPNQEPLLLAVEGLSLPDSATGLAQIPTNVPVLLGCAPGLVDVLACGPGYVAYSVFDGDGEMNLEAMAAVTRVSGARFDIEDEDTILLGPVLIVE